MEFLQPLTWAEALQLKAAYPHAVRSRVEPTSWSS